MPYNSTTGKISDPVSVADVDEALGTSSGDVYTQCNSSNINRWSKYKPVRLSLIDTLTGQWDFVNRLWLAVATWWHGIREALSNYAQECGFKIPKVDYQSEYRQQVYYYDDTAAIGIYTAPGSVPLGAWEYVQRNVARLTDFAFYSHLVPNIPMYSTWPSSPIRVTSSTSGITMRLQLNNRTHNDEALFINDMEELAGAQFCVKLIVNRYEDDMLYDTCTYEVAGDTVTANSDYLSTTFMKKLLMRSATEAAHTDMITMQPYLRKVNNGVIRLLSVGCENSQLGTLQMNFVTNAYKLRYIVGELDNATFDDMFLAGFSSNYSGIELYPVVGDAVSTLTTGHYIRLGGLFVKTIIDDVYGNGLPTGQYTVNVYIEDLNCNDYLTCIIPKTRILQFTTGTGNAVRQGYGYRGASDSPDHVGVTTLEFVDANNQQQQQWTFGPYGADIPILEPYDGEAWPPGPLNPNNDVVAKFRVVCEISPAQLQEFSVPQNGTGSYKKTDNSYNPYTDMRYWTVGYNFEVIEDSDSATGFSVIPDRQIAGTILSRDSGEVSDDYGTAAWMPLPAGWGDPTSIYQTE